VAVSQFVILAGLFVWARSLRRNKLWLPLMVWGVVCALLMVSPTLPFWNHLPELRFVQLPWRWLLCLNVPFALAISMGFQRWWWRIVLCIAMLGVLVTVWHRVQNPWWDNAGDIQEMLDNQQDGIGNEGADEYVPIGVDPYDADQKARQVRFEGKGHAYITVQKWDAEKRAIDVSAGSPGKLVLRLFNYPLWKVEVNSRQVITGSTPDTGQMVVPVAARENIVRIRFVEAWDHKVGLLLSGIGLAIIILLFVIWMKPQRF
jgi:hypothetical protein